MAIIKCKMCGGDLNLIEGASTAECEFCGSVQTIPNMDDEKKLVQFERAERLRKQCEFDKAAGIYETIVADFRQEAEAYWGLVLCKYGIEYVDDPATGKKIPTCHRSSFDSIMEDSDFEQALENADVMARRVYRDEAKQIEEIRKGIIAVSSNEEPYDIFICYKETAENGDRTLDSVLAQDVYDALTDKGYRVFFSRISLEDKLGMEYEPYIFAALNSAKIMLAFGTDYEYFNAVWVKNEWSRFLKLMAKDKDKHLIPCFKGIDAYDMPKEFARLQAQDLGKVGAIQDLLRGIEKIIPKHQENIAQPVIATQTTNSSTAPLLERAYMFLEDGNWKDAVIYCERVLDMDPQNAHAYIGKVMAELKVCRQEDLAKLANPFDNNANYQKAIRFADPCLKDALMSYNVAIREKIESDTYNRASELMMFATKQNNKSHENVKKAYEAATLFNQIMDYKDSAEQAKRAVNTGKQITYDIAINLQENAASIKEYEQAAAIFEKIQEYDDAAERAEQCRKEIKCLIKNKSYADACEKMARVSSAEGYLEAAEMFRLLGDFRDSVEQMNICLTKSEESKKENLYLRAMRDKDKKNTTGYISAIFLFETISGYKDAEVQCAECKKELDALRKANIPVTEEKTVSTLQADFHATQRREEERIATQRRNAGLCQHCGGELKGFFSKKCASCGKPKDY